MSAIVEELTIEAAPQRVWGAITQQDEIVQWWAYEARVKPEVGSLAGFPKALRNGQGPESPGNSRLSTTAPSWSSRRMGSPRLMREMSGHAGLGYTSWPV